MRSAALPTRTGGLGRIRGANPALLGATAAAVAWLALILLGPGGLFTIDELIYVAAAAEFAGDASIFVQNGYEHFGSEALRLWFLVAGPNGLAPQYPSGFPAVAAAPFAAFGPRGIMLLNAGAALGVLYLSHRLALRLFSDPAVARAAVLILALASFLGDYAVGIWPHAPSALVVVAGTLFLAEAVLGGAERNRDRLFALAAGLVIGMGLLVRLDSVLAVPPLLIWAIVVAPRPLRLVPPAALGMLPGVVAAALLNQAKFGTLNPFSYGSPDGGGTDPSGYLTLLLLIAIVIAGSVLLRSPALRHRAAVPGVIATVLMSAVILAVPALRDSVGDYLRGLYVLLVDLRFSSDPRHGVIRGEDGSVSFWGVSKKALGQSLPWLGLLAILAVHRWDLRQRYGIALLGLTTALWILPFARTEWHGGFGSNMRYLLPVLPHLAILTALAWRRTEAEAGEVLPFGAVLKHATRATVAAFLILILIFGQDGLVSLQHRLPPFLLVALAIAALSTAAPGHAGKLALTGCRGLFAASLCYAFLLGILDLTMNQVGRADESALREAAAREIPSESLLYTARPKMFPFQVERGRGLLANPPISGPPIDEALVRSALGNGLRVFVHGDALSALITRDAPDLRAQIFIGTEAGNALWEILPVASSGGGASRRTSGVPVIPPEF